MTNSEKPGKIYEEPSDDDVSLDPALQKEIEAALKSDTNIPHEPTARDRETDRISKEILGQIKPHKPEKPETKTVAEKESRPKKFEERISELEEWFAEKDKSQKDLPEGLRSDDRNETLESLLSDAEDALPSKGFSDRINFVILYKYFLKEGYHDTQSVIDAIDKKMISTKILRDIIAISSPENGTAMHESILREAIRSYRRAQQERKKA